MVRVAAVSATQPCSGTQKKQLQLLLVPRYPEEAAVVPRQAVAQPDTKGTTAAPSSGSICITGAAAAL